MYDDRVRELKVAQKGALVSILSYIFLALVKLIIAEITGSAALRADGLNNFTDILGSIAVLIGLHLASRPADEDHKYGHWKVENVASLITSFIMFIVGIQVLISSIQKIVNHEVTAPNSLAAYVGIFSGVIMILVYYYNHRLAKEVRSSALDAAAKDNLSDAFTSFGTTVAIIASSLGLVWLDNAAAVVIAILILKTALEIFSENAFSLSDGFDEELLETYRARIISIEGVDGIRYIRGRNLGSNTFLDVVVYMNPSLTVYESHEITEKIEISLIEEYQVFDVDIHVEPTPKIS